MSLLGRKNWGVLYKIHILRGINGLTHTDNTEDSQYVQRPVRGQLTNFGNVPNVRRSSVELDVILSVYQ